MLRLTLQTGEAQRPVIQVEGRVAGEWVALLEEECVRALNDQRGVELDLGRVTDVDSQGLMALRRLRQRSVTLVGCTPIMLAMLEEKPI
jgi:ABC-type transporter Mla MlaB component